MTTPIIRIAFADFWPDFDPHDNWLSNLLSTRFELVHDRDPDLVVYSVHGGDHRSFDCTRVLLSWENRPWGFSDCDWAFTSDYNRSPRHARLPIWVSRLADGDGRTTRDPATVLAAKDGFASIVVSNGSGATRNRIHDELGRYETVASGGRHRNNVGGPVGDKRAFIGRYKFNIACENSSRPGYTTEKLLEALQADTIPIYWGDPEVGRDFNLRRIVSAHEFPTMKALVDRVIELDRDDAAYCEVIRQPWFRQDRRPACADTDAILDRFDDIRRWRGTPVAARRDLGTHVRRSIDRVRRSHRYRTRRT